MFHFSLFQVLSGFLTLFPKIIYHTRALRMPCSAVVRGETLSHPDRGNLATCLCANMQSS